MRTAEPAATALGAIGAYNVVQNLVIPEAGYVPSNLIAAAALIALARRSGMSFADIGLGTARLRSGLALGGLVAVGVGSAFMGAARSGRFDRWLLDERARGHRRAGVAYRSLVRFPVGTALFEELAFRGVLDGLWRRRGGDGAAGVITAVAFGAWHVVPTYRLYPGMGLGAGAQASRSERVWAALGSGAVTAASGSGFTWLRRRSGSVAAPWLVHAAYNVGGYLAGRRAWQRLSS
jgi:membrane protease YdiL (CAAX protease family)